MEIHQLESEAKLAAIKDIKNMLQRPGQLEKVDQYRNRVARKKASVEAQLKTAMQSQLEGVRVGLKQLELSLGEIKEINSKLTDVDLVLSQVPPIYDALENVRDEYTKHSQYATALENIKHILTVQKNVATTQELIAEDKLLLAYQGLSELENSRDDLLFQLHKLPKQYAHDKITLKRYFEKVEIVSDDLQRKIRLILNRTLATVRKEPTQIVTALRIIEREEKADQFALQQQKQSGYISPGRPKKWREMAFNVMNEAVIQRIDGTNLEERGKNKLWLVCNLEIARQFILEDLQVVKTLCVPCFPPHYDIFNEYVKMYHSALSKHLEEISQSGLEGNEYVSLLSWAMNTYPGPELMGHPTLNVDLSIRTKSLIKPEELRKLEDQYLQNIEKNYEEWMKNTVETEKQEWLTNALPDHDDQEKYYHTSAPVIIFQMIDQHLQVTNTIHSELTFKALVLSIQQITQYGQSYRQAIVEFKERHFKDRSQMPFFTQHIITIINNCQQIMELAQQMKQSYWPKSRIDNYQHFENLLMTFQNLRNDVTGFLLQEAFLDLEIHFNELFTIKWLTSTNSIDTICVTLEDYFQDYNHLRINNFEYVINEAQKMVVRRYMKAMLSKRISKPKQECEVIAKKIVKESKQIRNFFSKIAPNMSDADSSIDLISTLSNLLICDIEMLVLDLHTLFGSYPSLTEDHLIRLFYIRNDIKANEVKERVQDAMKSKKSKISIDKQDDIFKELIFSDKLW